MAIEKPTIKYTLNAHYYSIFELGAIEEKKKKSQNSQGQRQVIKKIY